MNFSRIIMPLLARVLKGQAVGRRSTRLGRGFPSFLGSGPDWHSGENGTWNWIVPSVTRILALSFVYGFPQNAGACCWKKRRRQLRSCLSTMWIRCRPRTDSPCDSGEFADLPRTPLPISGVTFNFRAFPLPRRAGSRIKMINRRSRKTPRGQRSVNGIEPGKPFDRSFRKAGPDTSCQRCL